jgi:hypothetical protein
LSEFYTKAKEAGKSVSIVFASRYLTYYLLPSSLLGLLTHYLGNVDDVLYSDSDKPSFGEYFNSMSFPFAIPYGDDRVQALMTKWGIRGIPTLVVLDKNGNVLRANGRPDVQMNGVKALDAWSTPAPTTA